MIGLSTNPAAAAAELGWKSICVVGSSFLVEKQVGADGEAHLLRKLDF